MTEARTDANDLLGRIEAARLWAYFHKDWLLQIRTMVRGQLPRDYSVFVESEAILVTPSEGGTVVSFLPDLGVARPGGGGATPSKPIGKPSAAVLEVEEPCELFTQYTLFSRRAPDNRLVAACEILSPTNKGAFDLIEKEKHLRKRAQYFQAGVNLLEVDALLHGERLLPPSLAQLSRYARSAWTAFHHDGGRRLRGWDWNQSDPLPVVEWDVEERLKATVDLTASFDEAFEFNPWESLLAGDGTGQ